MAKSGLLILTSPLSALRPAIPSVLRQAASAVNDTLYVYLTPHQPGGISLAQDITIKSLPASQEVKEIISGIYLHGSTLCSKLDIRVLLAHFLSNSTASFSNSYSLQREVSVCLTDSRSLNDKWVSDKSILIKNLQQSFNPINSNCSVVLCDVQNNDTISAGSGQVLTSYPNVVVGGTFDRLHAGHKALLTECCLRCDSKLVIGVTDGDRNKSKLQITNLSNIFPYWT